MASLVADEKPAPRGLVCLGYPFHPRASRKACVQPHLRNLRTPTLIRAGDPRLPGLARGRSPANELSPAIRIVWLETRSLVSRGLLGTDGDPEPTSAVAAVLRFRRDAVTPAVAGQLGALGTAGCWASPPWRSTSPPAPGRPGPQPAAAGPRLRLPVARRLGPARHPLPLDAHAPRLGVAGTSPVWSASSSATSASSRAFLAMDRALDADAPWRRC